MAGTTYIGHAAIVMEARSAQLRAEYKKIRGANKRMRKSFLGLKSVLAGIGFAMLARRLLGVVKAEAAVIDQTAKLARRIGESTENLVGLQHAAKITGAGAERLAAGIDVLQKRLGEAVMGMGEGKAALDHLGLAAEDLIRKTPAEQFSIIADKVKGLSTQSEKAAITAKLFSRANQDLVNTLELGSKGLEAMKKQTQELGTAFSVEQAKKVEDMNDAITRMNAAFSGLARTLTIAVAPAMKDAAEYIAQLAGAQLDAAATTEAAAYYRKLVEEREAANKVWDLMRVDELKRQKFNEAVFEMKWRKYRAQNPEAFAERQLGLTTGPAGPGVGAAATADPHAKRFQRIEQSLMSEREALEAHYKEQSQITLDWYAGDEDRAVHSYEVQKRLTAQFQKQKTAIENKEIARRRAMRVGAVTNVISAVKSLASINMDESRKSFRIHKAASIAEVLVSTTAGAMRQFKDLPPWAAWASRASIIASGIASIAAIQSTTFQGGGTPSAAGLTSPGADAMAAAPPAAATPDVYVTLEGDSPGAMRRLIDRLNETIEDGYRLHIG